MWYLCLQLMQLITQKLYVIKFVFQRRTLDWQHVQPTTFTLSRQTVSPKALHVQKNLHPKMKWGQQVSHVSNVQDFYDNKTKFDGCNFWTWYDMKLPVDYTIVKESRHDLWPE